MIDLFPSRAIALTVFDFSIHWYGIMYLLGFLAGYALLPRLQKYRSLSLTKDDISSIMTFAVLGVILGGRLGYVLFYAPQWIWQDPLEIFAVWNGGMSSHGGFIGVTLALWYILRKKNVSFFAFADIAVIPVAIGLAFGRLGNFINLELYGTVTTLPWGIAIPGVEGLRHPTQFYAIIKDVSIALLCFVHLRATAGSLIRGRTMALFFMLYGVFRFVVEYFRVQDFPLTDLAGITLTRGQILTIPVFLIGILLWWYRGKVNQQG